MVKESEQISQGIFLLILFSYYFKLYGQDKSTSIVIFTDIFSH